MAPGKNNHLALARSWACIFDQTVIYGQCLIFSHCPSYELGYLAMAHQID
jgi:hypothetical protein